MPRQNRVNPFGELIVTPARGKFMGNRGVLHDEHGQLSTKRWTHNHWIICLTEFKGEKRPLMSPGCYTELFFLDEATALAAGHRPCAECRRDDFNRFKQAWVDGNLVLGLQGFVGVNTVDHVLHRERVTSDREKVTYEDRLGDLPDGVFVVMPDTPGVPLLVWENQLWEWSPEGYLKGTGYDPEVTVSVLTPASTVKAIKAGYVPQVALDSL